MFIKIVYLCLMGRNWSYLFSRITVYLGPTLISSVNMDSELEIKTSESIILPRLTSREILFPREFQGLYNITNILTIVIYNFLIFNITVQLQNSLMFWISKKCLPVYDRIFVHYTDFHLGRTNFINCIKSAKAEKKIWNWFMLFQ